MPTEQKYDVHRNVGCWFIIACGVIGILVGALIPIVADQTGLIHLGGSKPGVNHIPIGAALMFGGLFGTLGLITGVVLSINRKNWIVGLLIAAIPTGLFGALAAGATPSPYSHWPNALLFWSMPPMLSLLCVSLRDQLWKRHQKPVIGRSKSSP